MTSVDLFEFAKEAGLLGGAAAFIWALYKKKLRWGSDYDEIKTQRDDLYTKALAKLDRLEGAIEQKGAKE